MLCPEVWNFRAPQSEFKVRRGRCEGAVSPPEIHNLFYNHLVSVVIPDTLRVPESLTESLLNDCDYYKVSDLNLADLIDYNFIHNFVTKGKLFGLSINRKIDCEDCAAITPTKKLILSVDKDTYQQLGLEGKVSHFAKFTKSRYVVTIDLSEPCFKPGKKNYIRATECLKKLRNFTFIFTWDPPEIEICPSSLAKYFHEKNFTVNVCKPTLLSPTSYGLKVPKIDFKEVDDDDVFDLVEWIGMVSLDGDLENGSVDGFVNTYETPEPNEEIGQVRRFTWQGFYSSAKIETFLTGLKDFLKINEKPWLSLYVQGFSDSPVNWKENEHHYYTNGDNSYTIFLQENNEYLILTNKTSNKYHK